MCTLFIDGESDSKTVELDKEQLVFDFSKDTACLLLNASYAIAQKTAIQLELKEESISGEQVVIWSNQTAQVTIMPAPTEQGIQLHQKHNWQIYTTCSLQLHPT